MAGKQPRERDKGRCKRCPHSYLTVKVEPDKWVVVSKDTKRIKGRKQYLECSIYGRPCQRVAWNCSRIY